MWLVRGVSEDKCPQSDRSLKCDTLDLADAFNSRFKRTDKDRTVKHGRRPTKSIVDD
jgi:hypothetical protein